MQALPAHTCPLCGQPNQCAAARSNNLHEPCWCQNVRFDPEALTRIPPEHKNCACLCPACATKPGK